MRHKRPPRGLRRTTAAWWRAVQQTWALEEHHVKLLTLQTTSSSLTITHHPLIRPRGVRTVRSRASSAEGAYGS